MRKVVGKKEVDDERIFCETCKKDLSNHDGTDMVDDIAFFGQFSFGYGSKLDGFEKTIDLCTKCSKKLLKILKGVTK